MGRRRRGLLGAVAFVSVVALATAWTISASRSTSDTTAAASAGEQHPAAGVAPPVVTAAIARAAGDRAIAPPPATFDGPAAPTIPPPEGLTGPIVGRAATGTGVWAVTIGIDDYPGSGSDLRAAVADADDVDHALARFGVPAAQRLVIRNGQASAPVLRLAADWLAKHAGPDATAVFFYAGHVRKLSRTTEALVGADGDVVTDADLAAHLAPVRAGRMWVALAACYGGGFDEVLRPGRILTAAADANHLAYENDDLHRSYLVEYMVRRAMIDGAADTSIQAAYEWARAAIARDHPGRVPVEIDDAAGPLDLRMSPTAAPVSTAPPTTTASTARPTTASPRTPSPASPAGPSPSTTPPRRNGCATLTLGVVSCG